MQGTPCDESTGSDDSIAAQYKKKCTMRFWLSIPFIRRTRIGISVSDREIAHAIRRRVPTAKEREQRAAEEAEIEARAQALAKRWAPFVGWIIIITYVAIVIGLLIWGHYLASQLT